MKGKERLLNTKTMGRLGQLAAHLAEPKPGELQELADHYLTRGRQRRSKSDFLTTRQEENRARRELPLGDQAASVSLYPQPGCSLHQLG